MKKIMFNDKYGLTDAVLQGRKTMTRRLVGKRMTEDDIRAYLKGYTELANKCAQYKIGEVVAVAQSYKSIFEESLNYALPRYHWLDDHIDEKGFKNRYHWLNDHIDEKGFKNKMFVKASEMSHQIQITDIKVERLQDISEEDCLKEGVWIDSHREVLDDNIYTVDVFGKHYCQWHFPSAREAFSFLIDKVSGKGTWERNPWVFAYSFEIVK